MIMIDLWRCVKCGRILGKDVRLGDGSVLHAVCWSSNCEYDNVIETAPRDLVPPEEHVTSSVLRLETVSTATPAIPLKKGRPINEQVASEGGALVRGG